METVLQDEQDKTQPPLLTFLSIVFLVMDLLPTLILGRTKRVTSELS